MEDLYRDLRYGVRRLIQTPGFTIVALLTLALGIGANAAIFTLVNKMLLRPLPVQAPAEIIALNNASNDGRVFPAFSYLNYRDLRDRNIAIADLLAYAPTPVSLSNDGVNERVWSYIISGNYFAVLGLRPAAGRLISTEDDAQPGANAVTVISYDAWQKRFGGDTNAVGKNVVVNGRQFTVVGVAPRDFAGLEVAFTAEMWFPIMMQSQISPRSRWQDRRGFENLYIAGRLRPGVHTAAAMSAFRAAAAQLEHEYPNENQGKSIVITSAGLFGSLGRGPVMGISGVLMAVVGLVLLLVCTNLVNLCLARTGQRQREIAMQQALGASRWRIVRQLLTESLVLSTAGGLTGLALAYWLTGAASRFRLPIDIPLSYGFEMDWRVVVFTIVVSLLAGIGFGLMPAWQSTSPEMMASASRRSRLRNILVASQVCLSFMLMICAGLTLRSLQQAEFVDLGMNPQGAMELGFDLDLQSFTPERGLQFVDALITNVRSLPGIKAAGVGSAVPPDPHIPSVPLRIEGAPAPERGNVPRSVFLSVSPDYREAMGIPLLRGRDFNDNDVETSQPVGIINETFARRFWNGENPIGRRFALGESGTNWIEVVGVVRDGKYRSLGESPNPLIFVPMMQRYGGLMKIVVRTATGEGDRLEEIRREVHKLDPNLPIFDARSLTEHMRLPLFPARVAAAMFGSFGSLAMALAALGVFGVVSFSISRRTQEIGIRMALGARQTDVLRMILRQGMGPVAIGMTVGVLGAFILAPIIQISEVLYGVSQNDPITFGGIALMLGSVAFVACYLPARRAVKIDPLVALRHE